MKSLTDYKLCFWDFDGVIKESVRIKTDAYAQLFSRFGGDLEKQIRQHHQKNGGMSRFEKIPIYLEWSGVSFDKTVIDRYCESYSQIVMRSVIESPWVPGVESYLRKNTYEQIFVLVSATPQYELNVILKRLNLTSCFPKIYGSPAKKQEAIRNELNARNLSPNDCVMIGDSQLDLNSAIVNDVPFLLRRHKDNFSEFSIYSHNYIEDFTEYESCRKN